MATKNEAIIPETEPMEPELRRRVATKSDQCAFMRVEECQSILGVSLASVYNMAKQAAETNKPFRVILFNRTYLIEKSSFFAYAFGTRD